MTRIDTSPTRERGTIPIPPSLARRASVPNDSSVSACPRSTNSIDASTVKQFLIRRWFLVALAFSLCLGLGFPGPLTPLADLAALRQTIVVIVMFLMALPLETSTIWDSLRRPWAAMLATAINYGLLPVAACGTALILGCWPGVSEDMIFGILIAAAAPCTLASAAVWTRRAGGNDAAAIIVTIVTNLICFVVTPAWLYAMMGKMPSFEPLSMALKLALLVVLPIVLAQLVRPVGSIGVWASQHKTPIGVITQCGVLSMVFFGAIKTGSKLSGSPLSSIWVEIALTIAIVLWLHIIMLFMGTGLARLMRLSREDSIAVGFSGSQKSCMIGLEVCAQLGVTVLPMVAYHVGQLLADTVIADRFRKTRDS